QAPQNVVVGDIDGDGKPEITTNNLSSNTISVFHNKSNPGAILFANKNDMAAGTMPRGLYLGDLNGDGKPELATINYAKDSISIFPNIVGDSTVIPPDSSFFVGAARNSALLVLHPNPAKQYVSVIHPVTEHPAQILLIDMLGRVVRRMTASNVATGTKMMLTGLKSGSYSIIWNDGGKVMNRMLIITQ
ncbi:MAG TPA: T9SS type A sorting domain-containing protein, partial [Niastella sp.]